MLIDRENSLSIILPVFNEEKNIKHVVIDIITNIHKYIDDLEIIVVDDGSVDRSLDIIKDLENNYPVLRVIRNYRNRGYGFALRKGIDNAQKEWLFIMDADGQFKADDFRRFWLKKLSYDFIIGYRENRKDNTSRKICYSDTKG